MNVEQNELLTRTGPGSACGQLLRRYWQPVALVDEFDASTDPKMQDRPLKAVRVLGQDLVLFRDEAGRWGLIDRDCPHRGADLAFGRHEGDGLRCPFHGWKFDVAGQCLETPAEPLGSTLCTRIRQRSYPLVERSGVLFAWLGEPGTQAPFPDYDCFAAPGTHTFAYKGLWHCNWLQAVEVGIDPAHTSFLHRFLEDASLESVGNNAGARQFRSATLGEFQGEAWPMSRIMREFHRPDIQFEPEPWGYRISTLRAMSDELTHVRITHALFPQAFCIPLSPTLTITQWHVPVDDTHTFWYAFFTSYGEPVDKRAMRDQRAPFIPPPAYVPTTGRHNDWGFDALEQRTRTYLGMGENDINVHDQWAVESMGAIQDRTREHLGTSDKVIAANRRQLLAAIEAVRQGGTAPFAGDPQRAGEQVGGPDTVDGIAPAREWQSWWREQAGKRQAASPWAGKTRRPHAS